MWTVIGIALVVAFVWVKIERTKLGEGLAWIGGAVWVAGYILIAAVLCALVLYPILSAFR